MPAYDFKAPRLHVEADLAPGAVLPLDRAQANYLLNVLRRGEEDPVLVFNGRDGEWRATLVAKGRKDGDLHCREQTRPQAEPADLHYLFAPLKSARLDYLAQKAVEMGAGTIRPVLTRFTQGDRINLDRLRANTVEAAEQCGILAIPRCLPLLRLSEAMAALEPGRLLVFCDEDAPIADPVRALSGAADPAVRRRSPSSSAPRGASRRKSGKRSGPVRTRWPSPWGHGSCAPIRRRWPSLPWSSPSSAIVGDSRIRVRRRTRHAIRDPGACGPPTAQLVRKVAMRCRFAASRLCASEVVAHDAHPSRRGGDPSEPRILGSR